MAPFAKGAILVHVFELQPYWKPTTDLTNHPRLGQHHISMMQILYPPDRDASDAVDAGDAAWCKGMVSAACCDVGVLVLLAPFLSNC